jgi:hypothetical protein
MNFVQRNAMHPGFGATQSLKNRQRTVGHAFGESGTPNQIPDLGIAAAPTSVRAMRAVRAVIVGMRVPPPRLPALGGSDLPRNRHLEETRGQTAAPSPTQLESVSHTESGQVLLELLALEAKIEQRSGKHVARNSRERIKVKDSWFRKPRIPGSIFSGVRLTGRLLGPRLLGPRLLNPRLGADLRAG